MTHFSDWLLNQRKAMKEAGVPDIVITEKGGVGSGNFGHAGRPGKVGGSSEGGKPDNIFRSEPKKLQSVYDTIIQGGGITWHTKEGTKDGGYVVAIPPIIFGDKKSERLIKPEDFSPKTLVDYMDDFQKIIVSNPNFHLGAWIDPRSGLICLDISEVYEDLETCMKLGRERKQKAIYDLKNKVDIPIDADEGRISLSEEGQEMSKKKQKEEEEKPKNPPKVTLVATDMDLEEMYWKLRDALEAQGMDFSENPLQRPKPKQE